MRNTSIFKIVTSVFGGFFMNENKITRLAVQKNNPKRVNVFLNGEFAFGLYRETAAWLEIGQNLSDEKINELLLTDQKKEVMFRAIEYISYKPRTTQETRRKLQNAGYDESLIEKTLSHLSENGLLDDKTYADRWVAERLRLKPRSKRMLTYELRKKGIPEDLIQSAVEDIDDLESALEISKKRLYKYDGLSKYEFRSKLGNFLAGKGFSFDIISETTDIMWHQIKSSAD